MGLTSQLRIQNQAAIKKGEQLAAEAYAPVQARDYYELVEQQKQLQAQVNAEPDNWVAKERLRAVSASITADPETLAAQKMSELEAKREAAKNRVKRLEEQRKDLERRGQVQQGKMTGTTLQDGKATIQYEKIYPTGYTDADVQAAQADIVSRQADIDQYITAKTNLAASLSKEKNLESEYRRLQKEKEDTKKIETYKETVQVAVLANELPNWKGEANMQKYRPGAGAVVVGYKPVEVTRTKEIYDPKYDALLSSVQSQLKAEQESQNQMFSLHS
jgi:hypothetical protein